MIVTLTVNPSLDRTVEVDTLVRGAVLRATASRVDPGGKGINVARALARNGVPALAVLASGGPEGDRLTTLLGTAGVAVRAVAVHGSVRTNVAVVEPDGTTTKVNEAGPALDAGEVASLVDAVVASSRGATWVVLSGSLPPGVPPTLYATLVRRVHGAGARGRVAGARVAGARVAVDSSGDPFIAALAAGPDLVKPNREELSEATRRPVDTFADVVAACRDLRRRGAGAVLASLGRDGAVLIGDDDTPLCGATSVVATGSAVGAGDAMLAGFLAAGGDGAEALVEGLAWGAAAASLPGSVMPGPTDLDRTSVTVSRDIDLARRLSG